MASPADAVRDGLDRVQADRAVIARERAMLDAWEAGLDREEHAYRRALPLVDGALFDLRTGMPFKPQATQAQRNHVLDVLNSVGPAYESGVPQVELRRHTRMDSGALSRAVRDLEAMGRLERRGVTARRSPRWVLVRK